jgi:vitamin B12 transporter
MISPALVAARACARRRRLLATTFLAGALTSSGWIEASAQDAAALELPTVEVRSATLVPTSVDRIASSVTVITAAEIERSQKHTVPDILATVPGLNIVQTGAPGGTTSVFMRGTAANHVKLMVDGIDIGDPTVSDGSPDLAQLTAGDIDRIEVLRGPQSGLYGSDAIGGVISITTKKGAGPAKVTAKVDGGSFGTFNQSAGISGSRDAFNYTFNVDHYRTGATPVVPDRWLKPGQSVPDAAYDNKTVSSRLGYDFNDNFSVNWTGRYTDADYYYNVDINNAPSDYRSRQVTHQFFTRGEGVWTALDGRVKSYFGANFTDMYRWIYKPTSAAKATIYDYLGQRYKYDWHSVIDVIPGQTLVVGADHDTDRYRQLPVDKEVVDKGAFVELQSSWADRLFLVSNFRQDEHETFGGHHTYRFAPAVLVPGSETKLKATYGTGFKAPSPFQLYSPNYGNTGLKPEESTGWDAGFEQPIGRNFVRFGAIYFKNDLTNMIQYVQTGTSTGYYGNVAQAKTSGVETFATWFVTADFRVRGDYTYTEATDQATGLELARRPRHKGSVAAEWNPTEALSLRVTALHVGSWYDNYDRNIYMPNTLVSGYTVVNLGGEYKVNDATTMFARIDNLFDKHYENPLGYAKTGIGVYGGVRVSFGEDGWQGKQALRDLVRAANDGAGMGGSDNGL